VGFEMVKNHEYDQNVCHLKELDELSRMAKNQRDRTRLDKVMIICISYLPIALTYRIGLC